MTRIGKPERARKAGKVASPSTRSRGTSVPDPSYWIPIAITSMSHHMASWGRESGPCFVAGAEVNVVPSDSAHFPGGCPLIECRARKPSVMMGYPIITSSALLAWR